MNYLVPRPLRDLAVAPFCVQPGYGERVADRMISAVMRISLIAGAIYVMQNETQIAIGAIALGGAALSLPAVVMAGGSYVLYEGSNIVIAAIASNSFEFLGQGCTLLAAGWLTLEFHDFIPFGSFGIAEIVTDYLIKSIIKHPLIRIIS